MEASKLIQMIVKIGHLMIACGEFRSEPAYLAARPKKPDRF
jgi:hypothetical protein